MTTGVDTFDSTIQETNLWLKAVEERLGGPDRRRAYGVTRAVLHALRDRIGPENASHLGAQLPTLLRGVFYEGWHMAGTPSKERHMEEFLGRVRRDLPRAPDLDAEDAARAVIDVLWERIDRG